MLFAVVFIVAGFVVGQKTARHMATDISAWTIDQALKLGGKLTGRKVRPRVLPSVRKFRQYQARRANTKPATGDEPSLETTVFIVKRWVLLSIEEWAENATRRWERRVAARRQVEEETQEQRYDRALQRARRRQQRWDALLDAWELAGRRVAHKLGTTRGPEREETQAWLENFERDEDEAHFENTVKDQPTEDLIAELYAGLYDSNDKSSDDGDDAEDTRSPRVRVSAERLDRQRPEQTAQARAASTFVAAPEGTVITDDERADSSPSGARHNEQESTMTTAVEAPTLTKIREFIKGVKSGLTTLFAANELGGFAADAETRAKRFGLQVQNIETTVGNMQAGGKNGWSGDYIAKGNAFKEAVANLKRQQEELAKELRRREGLIQEATQAAINAGTAWDAQMKKGLNAHDLHQADSGLAARAGAE